MQSQRLVGHQRQEHHDLCGRRRCIWMQCAWKQLALVRTELPAVNKVSSFILCSCFCQGDSGGPLNCAGQDGRWYVQGVTSFVSSRTCNEVKKPTVFTRTSAFTQWLSDVSSSIDALCLIYSRSVCRDTEMHCAQMSLINKTFHVSISHVLSAGHAALLRIDRTIDQL